LPTWLTVDRYGNIVVTDFGNSVVRRVSPLGDVTTVAGNATVGAFNGIGTTGTFNQPLGVVVDSFNNTLVSDFNNYRIRKINPQGKVSFFAGSYVSNDF
jgi:hypothetical protein